MATFLNTLISHSPRYSKLVLIDNQGNEVLRAPQGAKTDPRFGYHNHAHTDYFKGANELFQRDIYISPPGRNLQYELLSGLRHNTPLALIAIDIDHFKHINDEYGHDAGDEVLKHFTHVMMGLLRQEDLLCRVGGEEFAILLPNTAIAQASQIAERIRATIENTHVPIEHEGGKQTLHITASFGVTHISPQETTLKAALKRADTGLYEAKETGRNRIVIKAN